MNEVLLCPQIVTVLVYFLNTNQVKIDINWFGRDLIKCGPSLSHPPIQYGFHIQDSQHYNMRTGRDFRNWDDDHDDTMQCVLFPGGWCSCLNRFSSSDSIYNSYSLSHKLTQTYVPPSLIFHVDFICLPPFIFWLCLLDNHWNSCIVGSWRIIRCQNNYYITITGAIERLWVVFVLLSFRFRSIVFTLTSARLSVFSSKYTCLADYPGFGSQVIPECIPSLSNCNGTHSIIPILTLRSSNETYKSGSGAHQRIISMPFECIWVSMRVQMAIWWFHG